MLIGGMEKDIEHIKKSQTVLFNKIDGFHKKIEETTEKHDAEQELIKVSLVEIATKVSSIHQPCEAAVKTSIELDAHKEEQKNNAVKASLLVGIVTFIIMICFRAVVFFWDKLTGFFIQ